MLEVLQSGVFTTLQDLGRGGNESFGVPPSGAFDPFLASVANRLVGNEPTAPLLEFALIGPSFKIHQETSFAIAAHSCNYLLNGTPVPQFAGFHASAGSELRFVNMKGWFGYLAVGGGFHADTILGSVSAYLPGGIGKRLEKGMTLQTHGAAESLYCLELEILEGSVPILPALHTDQFEKSEREKFSAENYIITTQSNRMGIRLKGTAIAAPEVRRSAPILSGTIQVPSGGQPIVLGPDGPTTGGYAQLGVIARVGWTMLAMKQPGSAVNFRATNSAEAKELYAKRQASTKFILL